LLQSLLGFPFSQPFRFFQSSAFQYFFTITIIRTTDCAVPYTATNITELIEVSIGRIGGGIWIYEEGLS
jgi:hypothetical protein